LKTAQRAADPADAHPELMNVLDAQCRVSFNQADGIACDLPKAFIEYRTKGLIRPGVVRIARRA
jgi:hypothetical protein